MTDKCNCFEENLERVKSHLETQIPDGSIDKRFEWQGKVYYMSGDYSPVNPKVEFSYRAPKKSGGHKANLTRNTVSMTAKYCCFCGRELSLNK